MKVISLQSGSNGNCIYVESKKTRLLFDAGISGIQAQQRLEKYGRQISTVDGLLISHDHIDHTRCMGIYHRKFGLPVYITETTFTQTNDRRELGAINPLCHFRAGDRFVIGTLSIETIPTPHDAIDGVAFVVDDGKRRVGILTDLGHVFDGLSDVVASLNAVVIESNYDPHMLANGPYPESLRERIRGRGGHLSNVEAAELVAAARKRKLRWVCLAHLSEQNNDPQIALEAHRKRYGDTLPLCVASRYQATEILEV